VINRQSTKSERTHLGLNYGRYSASSRMSVERYAADQIPQQLVSHSWDYRTRAQIRDGWPPIFSRPLGQKELSCGMAKADSMIISLDCHRPMMTPTRRGPLTSINCSSFPEFFHLFSNSIPILRQTFVLTICLRLSRAIRHQRRRVSPYSRTLNGSLGI